MKKRFFNLQLFDTDVQIIDRSGAEALIPEDRAKEIIQGAIEQSAVLSVGRRLADMTTAQNKLPVLDSLPIAYFVNGDTGTKKTTKQAWDKKVIYAEEIAVIVPIPEAVLDDADYDIWGEVKPRVQEAFGKVIDAAILFGDGKPTNWRDGLVPSAKTAGASVVMGNDLFTDLLGEGGVISKVEESGFFVNGHVADISLRAKLRGLKDQNDRPLFLNSMQQSGNYSLDGSAIYFPRNGAFDKTEAMLISGDFSQLVYSIRKDITFKLFTEGVVQNTDGTIAYNLMQNDMVALRAVMRLGWEIPNPINSLEQDKTKRFPFAVLAPATTGTTLTVTSAAGTNSGDTKITVSPALSDGNSYKYKTGPSVTKPAIGAICKSGYTAWDGSADIAAKTGDKIVIVEVDSTSKCEKTGDATVTAKA